MADDTEDLDGLDEDALRAVIAKEREQHAAERAYGRSPVGGHGQGTPYGSTSRVQLRGNLASPEDQAEFIQAYAADYNSGNLNGLHLSERNTKRYVRILMGQHVLGSMVEQSTSKLGKELRASGWQPDRGR